MDAMATCLLITILPTVVIFLVPLLSTRAVIPFTSLLANLLTNVCMGFLLFGVHSVAQEGRSAFQSGAWLAVGMLAAVILLYLVFAHRVVDLPLRAERDSIAYVPSLVRHTFFDVYGLSELVIRFVCNPPMVVVRAEAFHADGASGEPAVTFVHEREVEYGSWRDVTALPIQFPLRALAEFRCRMDYAALPPELERRSAGEEAAAAAVARAHDAQVRVGHEIATPGFAPRVFATTRGEVPAFVAFMTSDVGARWQRFLLFLGYHSALEAAWLMLFSTEELVFSKELSLAEEWTPAGEVALVDYQTWPRVV
jgi:hypothetical protein